ncbi:hypothetical protein BDB01DRAFT_704303, partial [Pilobolus umbonatus]
LLSKLFSPRSHPVINTSKWKYFWRQLLHPSSSVVWYRALHQKLPVKQLLHKLSPNYFTSPYCHHCAEVEEDLIHFLIACPLKLAVWKNSLTTFFPDTPFSKYMLQIVLLQIEPIHWPLLSPVAASLSLFQIVGSIQHSIWKSHWSSVFDNLPF